jgi:hypothetical protein
MKRLPLALALPAALAVALALGGCSNPSADPAAPEVARPVAHAPDTGPPLFEDLTATAGVAYSYRNGEEVVPAHLSILESLGGGLAVIDYDGDGLLDLLVVGGGHFGGAGNRDILGHPCKLYRNVGGLRFEDATERAGLATLAGGVPWFYSHGAAVADYDRDGWPDLLVTGWGRVALFRNEPAPEGGRRFTDVSAAAGLDKGVTWATSAGWADFDGDGFPDFYACQYVDWSFANHPTDCTYGGPPDVCPPKRFKGLRHLVFRNNGDGTFKDVSAAAGLHPGGEAAGKGLGLVVVDVNGDGKPDVYVANDTVANFLYVNRSTPGAIAFDEQGLRAGVALDGFSSTNGSMGADAGDPARTGRPWLFCTNYENELHALYNNRSTPKAGATAERVFFLYATPGSGMAALGQKFVGWGAGFADLDRDGWEDVVIVNGHAIRFPVTAERRQKPVLLMNAGGGKFEIASARGGPYFRAEHLSRGMVLADFDNDGRPDIAVSNVNEPVAVLRNVSPDNYHWVGLTLAGVGHADVVGATVRLTTADGVTQTRFAKGGGSYASSPDRRMLFGLGSQDKVTNLTVTWPDGTTESVTDVPLDRYHVLTKGDKTLKPPATPTAR